MIRFLFKGLLRDSGRSRLPVIVVGIGVALSVFLHAYLSGLLVDMIEMTARFSAGHLKVMTRAYAENSDQVPNDLAITDAGKILGELRENYPEIEWTPRIRFGGLIDVPDSAGETRAQGSAMGIGIDMLSGNTSEVSRLNLEKSLVRGDLPSERGDILLSEMFSEKLNVNPGDHVTLIGSTMNGSMAIANFRVAGTVRFGTTALDRGTLIADISDVQQVLEMHDATGEITGFMSGGYYEDEAAKEYLSSFNSSVSDKDDEYAPAMISLRDETGMESFLFMADNMSFISTLIFMIAMSLVLWNAGLLGGLRRYGEMGVRLAIGENKGHVYMTMIYEAVMIGIAGTIIGTLIGLFFAFLLQKYGLDISTFTKGASSSSIMMPDTIRARITPADYYIGFIPGVISTVVGTALAGIGIFKRKTAQLFKELES
jgi:putative ABC transport system permease protein